MKIVNTFRGRNHTSLAPPTRRTTTSRAETVVGNLVGSPPLAGPTVSADASMRNQVWLMPVYPAR